MPVTIPAAVLARAQDAARAVGALAGVDVDAGELLGGRAALLGLRGRGTVSAGGASRLMKAADGFCALTLSRSDDIDAVPALLEVDGVDDLWPAVQRRVEKLGVGSFAERARLLGLPVGVLGETAADSPTVGRLGARTERAALADLLVVDMSSMWAGPLCGGLLARAGATVVKVESAARPDGTRSGPSQFFDWINGGKLSYEVDFTRTDPLRRMLAAADVVIESSRPSTLPRRGLGPADSPARNGRIWLRITGHGADPERGGWVAFGDDAAVSGGLVAGRADAPAFCGDAIADPLTGIHAALAVLQSRDRGGGELIDVSMAAVAASYAPLPRDDERKRAAQPSVLTRAARLGSDNDAVDQMVTERLAAAC